MPRFSSRTLDVDIVFYDDLVLRGPGNLEIPRRELKHAFVLKPLVDLAPTLRHPVLGCTLTELWQRATPAERASVTLVEGDFLDPADADASA